MLSDTQLYPTAGASAVVALIALVISGVALALFFGGAGAFWGPVNDMFVVVTVLALILPILAVDRLAAQEGVGWMRFVSIAAIVGRGRDRGRSDGARPRLPHARRVVRHGRRRVHRRRGVAHRAAGTRIRQRCAASAVGWAAIAVLLLIVVEAVVAMVMMGPLVAIASVALVAALSACLWTLSSTLLARSVA